MKYFTPNPIALFDESISSDIPESAIEISESVYDELIRGQEAGKTITADQKGRPVLTDPPPLSHEELIQSAEYERERLLKHADEVILDWRTELMLGEISDANRAKLSAWLAYKNEVKSADVTTDPERVNWPVLPEA